MAIGEMNNAKKLTLEIAMCTLEMAICTLEMAICEMKLGKSSP